MQPRARLIADFCTSFAIEMMKIYMELGHNRWLHSYLFDLTMKNPIWHAAGNYVHVLFAYRRRGKFVDRFSIGCRRHAARGGIIQAIR